VGPVPVNPWVSTGLARPVGSNFQFRVSGFAFIITFISATVDFKIVPWVR
jgi:hypothetical protein